MHQKHIPEDWMRKKSWLHQKMETLYFLWQMVQQNYQEETGIHRKEGESHGDREEFQETKDDEGINKDFWAHAEAQK